MSLTIGTMSATATPAIRAAARLRCPDKRCIHCTATRTSAIQEQKSQTQNCDVCDFRDFALGTNGQRHRIGLWRDSCSRQKTQKNRRKPSAMIQKQAGMEQMEQMEQMEIPIVP
jgi:hypothetical protein